MILIKKIHHIKTTIENDEMNWMDESPKTIYILSQQQ